MAKVKVIVSMEIAARASCVVEVEEKIAGVYGGPEDRAKDHVIACMAIGADVTWEITHSGIKTPRQKYDIDAKRADAVEPPAPMPAPDRMREDEVVF